MSPSPGAEELSLAVLRQIDPLCDRFEAAWRGGQTPRIEDHLPEPSSSLHAVILRELILLDAFYRRQTGQPPRPEDYQERFAALEPGWAARALAGTEPT